MKNNELYKCLGCFDSYPLSKEKLKKCSCGCKVFIAIHNPKTNLKIGSNLLFSLLELPKERKAMEKLIMKFCKVYSHFNKPVIVTIDQIRKKWSK